MIAGAVVFLCVAFSVKTGWPFKKSTPETKIPNLIGTETIQELSIKDTDGDGVFDWEEGLWGTDPLKAETKSGTPDSVAVAQLKKERGINTSTNDANLTKTEQFTRDLLSTVAILNQSGQIDQNTIETLSNSISKEIENPTQKKVYKLTDIKIIQENTTKNIQTYNRDAGTALINKYPIDEKIVKVLQDSLNQDGDVDINKLDKLDPINKQIQEIITGLLKVKTPSKLALLHLNLINTFQNVSENLGNIKQIENDPIVAMNAILKYPENSERIDIIIEEIKRVIKNLTN